MKFITITNTYQINLTQCGVIEYDDILHRISFTMSNGNIIYTKAKSERYYDQVKAALTDFFINALAHLNLATMLVNLNG